MRGDMKEYDVAVSNRTICCHLKFTRHDEVQAPRLALEDMGPANEGFRARAGSQVK